MGHVPKLGQMVTIVAVRHLLRMNDRVDDGQEGLDIRLLKANIYTAVSGDLLTYIVENFPHNLTNDLLEALAPPHLSALSLQRCRNVTAMGIERLLSNCKRLRKLNLAGVDQLMRPTFFQLCGLTAPQLTAITLDGNRSVTDKCVHAILMSFPNLEVLNLAQCNNLTDEAFLLPDIEQASHTLHSRVAGHNQATYRCRLRSVNVQGCWGLTSMAIHLLTTLCGPTLTRVDISCTKIDSTALLYLAGYSIASVVELTHAVHDQKLFSLLEKFELALQTGIENGTGNAGESPAVGRHHDLPPSGQTEHQPDSVTPLGLATASMCIISDPKYSDLTYSSSWPGTGMTTAAQKLLHSSSDTMELGSLCQDPPTLVDPQVMTSEHLDSDGILSNDHTDTTLLEDAVIVPEGNPFQVPDHLTSSVDGLEGDCDKQVEEARSFLDNKGDSDNEAPPEKAPNPRNLAGSDNVRGESSDHLPSPHDFPMSACLGIPQAHKDQWPFALETMPGVGDINAGTLNKEFKFSSILHPTYRSNLQCLDIMHIDLDEEDLGNACLQLFCLANPHLRQLSMSWKRLHDGMLCFIMHHQPHMQDLSLSECSQVTTLGLATMCLFSPHILHLNLQGIPFIEDTAVWSVVSQLSTLNLAETSITDHLLKRLAKVAGPKLVDLDLSWCEEVTVAGLDAVAQHCTSLRSLSLRHIGITDQTISLLSHNCPQLQRLVMPSLANITNSGLEHLAYNVHGLRHLDISWNMDITDDGVSTVLAYCGELQELNLAGNKRLTILPFLPIIAERNRWRRCQALLQLKLHEQKLLEESGDQHLSSDEEYEELYLPHRSIVYAAKLRWINLEYCDMLDDTKLSEIVAVCRGTLEIKDYYSALVKPAFITCRHGKVFLAPH